MSKPFDPWAVSTGLVESIEEGEITNAFFGYDSDIKENVCYFKLVINTNDPDIGDDGEHIEAYSCGDGWEPADKEGSRVQREDGKEKNFNRSSKMGKLTTAAITLAEDNMRDRGAPFEAATWIGLKFSFEQTELGKFKGEPYFGLMPTEYLGTVETGKKTSKPASSKPASTPKATPAASTSSNGGGELDPKLRAQLMALAVDCDSHAQFVERAFSELEGVSGNKEVEKAVIDRKPGSLYAEATS